MKSNTITWTNPEFWADSLTMIKPRITLLALITAAAGLFIAPVSLSLVQIIATLGGIFLLVGGASALNMFLEKDTDHLMERTRNRPLPGKRLSPQYGLGLGCVLVGFAIPILYFLLNFLTAFLGFLSLIIYVLIYTPLKRQTVWSLWIGAIPGAAPPLLGWSAATGRLGLPGWVLFGIIFAWQIPHFLAIGTFRREEYAAAGLKLFPQDQSPGAIKFQMVFFSFLSIPLSLSLYWLNYAGVIYYGLAIALNVFFFGAVLWGVFSPAEQKWGKRVFFASLVYLTLLFAILFLDGGPQ